MGAAVEADAELAVRAEAPRQIQMGSDLSVRGIIRRDPRQICILRSLGNDVYRAANGAGW